MLPKLQPAGDLGGLLVGVQPRHLPGGSEKQQAVNRQAVAIAPDLCRFRIQQVALAVGPICVAVQAIRPRSQERDAGLRGFPLPVWERCRRRHENRLTIHSQVVSDVADRGADRNFGLMRAIAQANDFDRIDDQLLRGISFSHDVHIISQ